ncbi:MAG: helix-turn-helix transcriptional regulator [Spirochaetota bacterium]
MRERSHAASSGPVLLRLAFAGGQAAEMSARIAREGIVIVGDDVEAELVAALPGSSRLPAHSASAARDDPGLSPRELEILDYLADGWSNAEIASVLGIGLRTVRFHLEGLYSKLGASRRGEAVREGVRLGLVSFEA